MTAPDPSGCAITGGHRLAVALLATEPPELGDVREALHLARAAGQPTVTVTTYDLAQVLGSVDYLQQQLAAECAMDSRTDDPTARPPGGEG